MLLADKKLKQEKSEKEKEAKKAKSGEPAQKVDLLKAQLAAAKKAIQSAKQVLNADDSKNDSAASFDVL